MTGLLSAWAGSPQARERISHVIQQLLQREDHGLDVTVLNILARSFARQNSVEVAVLAQQTFHQLMEQQNTDSQPDCDGYACRQCCSAQQQQQADCPGVAPSKKANSQCLLLI
jgi:hypothetical protein